MSRVRAVPLQEIAWLLTLLSGLAKLSCDAKLFSDNTDAYVPATCRRPNIPQLTTE